MYQKLQKEAQKKVEAKLTFYICALVFSFTTVVLLILSFYLPSIAIWLLLPVPIFLMVLGVLYLMAFGLPNSSAFSGDWKEEEIEKEMVRLYRQKKARLMQDEERSETETLELKELERLEEKWDQSEDYV